MITRASEKHPGSFRDPSGFVFTRNGKIYRQVNQKYKAHYDFLLDSKLYDKLVEKKLLIRHEEVSEVPYDPTCAFKIIAPQEVSFISYPFEWCFSQLKDAALLTLDILLRSLDAGMILKDASAYNVQFNEGKPVFVDTLSFEIYTDGQPWIGYRQFCQHFLAPLALMSLRDVRLGRLLSVHIDGVPLDLASKLLPASTWFNPRLLTHLHLHSRWQVKNGSESAANTVKQKVPLHSLKALVEDLKGAVTDLKVSSLDSTWVDYYEDNNYDKESADHKAQLVSEFLSAVNARRVFDLGANIGKYSRLAASIAPVVVSADYDHSSVETNYLRCVSTKQTRVLPLVIDLTNPSGPLGFANSERESLAERAHADVVMALALIHHLCIVNNVPLENAARFFSLLGNYLIIEFVPKEDSQVKRMLASREDIFVDYSKTEFEKAFSKYFAVVNSCSLNHSKRVLYLMRKLDVQ